ncbi:hypothetical protein BDZ45DRAFT_454721 [Acephala macrosclerotiorum]|nr:hypothetical protein BDZ45DRAFT_454721 [Acephala macrosclerotiorum]
MVTAPSQPSTLYSPQSSPLNVPSTIPEEEERSSNESPIEPLAAWARGLGKKTKKSSPSLRPKKRLSDSQVPTVPKLQVVGPSSEQFHPDSGNYTNSPESRDEFTTFPQPESQFPDMPELPADGRSTNLAPATLGRQQFSRPPASPSSQNSMLAGQSRGPSRFSSHVQAQYQPRGLAEERRRHDRAVSDPGTTPFSPDDIHGIRDPVGNGYMELDAQQLLPASPPARDLEGLSEEEQIQIALAESMKIF